VKCSGKDLDGQKFAFVALNNGENQRARATAASMREGKSERFMPRANHTRPLSWQAKLRFTAELRYPKNTTLPLAKVTPLIGCTNFGGIYDQSNGP
jgi:hypothetical protein